MNNNDQRLVIRILEIVMVNKGFEQGLIGDNGQWPMNAAGKQDCCIRDSGEWQQFIQFCAWYQSSMIVINFSPISWWQWLTIFAMARSELW